MRTIFPAEMPVVLIVILISFFNGCTTTQDSGEITAALADHLTKDLDVKGGTVKPGDPPTGHKGDSKFPQVTDVTGATSLIGGQPFSWQVTGTFTDLTKITGAIVHIQKASYYISVTAAMNPDSGQMVISGTYNPEAEIQKNAVIEFGLVGPEGVGNYYQLKINVDSGSVPDGGSGQDAGVDGGDC